METKSLIEVIEKLSDTDNSIGLKFQHSNGSQSAVYFPKEDTVSLYESLIIAANYIAEHMIEKNISILNEST